MAKTFDIRGYLDEKGLLTNHLEVYISGEYVLTFYVKRGRAYARTYGSNYMNISKSLIRFKELSKSNNIGRDPLILRITDCSNEKNIYLSIRWYNK